MAQQSHTASDNRRETQRYIFFTCPFSVLMYSPSFYADAFCFQVQLQQHQLIPVTNKASIHLKQCN